MFGIEWKYIFMAIIAAVIGVFFVITVVRNRQIRRKGIETEAVISKVEEHDHVDGDGTLTVTCSYYVTYEDREGNTREAILSKIMQSRYRVGDELRIRYLPEKPQYAFPIKKPKRNP